MTGKFDITSPAMSDQSWRVNESEAGLRLDKWLAAAERLGSRSKALSAIERGKVFVNGAEQTATDAARRLQKGETVRLWFEVAPPDDFRELIYRLRFAHFERSLLQ
jgi:ribosomal 50S subunit-recycling heat shock protein